MRLFSDPSLASFVAPPRNISVGAELRVVVEDGSAEANLSPSSYLETSRGDQGFGSTSANARDNFDIEPPRNGGKFDERDRAQ